MQIPIVISIFETITCEFYRVFFELDSFLHSMPLGFYGVGRFIGVKIVVLDMIIFMADGFQVHFSGEAGVEDVHRLSGFVLFFARFQTAANPHHALWTAVSTVSFQTISYDFFRFMIF